MALTRINNQALTNVTSAGIPQYDGAIIQTKKVTSTTQAVVSSTSTFTDVMSITITPQYSTSDILLHYAIENIYLLAASSGMAFRLLRDSTAIFAPTSTFHYSNWANDAHHTNHYSSFLDSPSTTSAITYKLQAIKHASGAVEINDQGYFEDTFIAQEIARSS